MRRRTRRRLLNIALFIVLLPLLLFVAVRLMRHRASAPDPQMSGVVRVRNLFTDLYGLRAGDRIVIFDGGIDGEGHALDTLIGALGGRDRDAVTDVFLTHGHFDHVAEAPLCKSARIHLGRGDVEMLARRAPAVPAAAVWLSHAAPVGPIEADSPLDGPTTFTLADGKTLLALPLPGHTPGSYVYYVDRVLIVGDSMQIDGDRLEFAIGFVSVDTEANRRSVAGLRDALAGHPVEVVCTGHQGCTPPGRGGAMLDALIARAATP